MGKHRSSSNNKLAGGLLLGAVASGALAVAALSGAGTAGAGCVSISGQTFVSGGGGTCSTSTDPGNIAVANGAGSGAFAGLGGPGNIAIAAGTAATGPSALSEAVGGGNFALAHGNPGNNNGAVFGSFPPIPISFDVFPNANAPVQAIAQGVSNKAFAIGDGSTAQAFNFDSPTSTPSNNVATSVGLGSNSLAVSGNALTTPIAAGQIANAIGNNVNSLNTP